MTNVQSLCSGTLGPELTLKEYVEDKAVAAWTRRIWEKLTLTFGRYLSRIYIAMENPN